MKSSIGYVPIIQSVHTCCICEGNDAGGSPVSQALIVQLPAFISLFRWTHEIEFYRICPGSPTLSNRSSPGAHGLQLEMPSIKPGTFVGEMCILQLSHSPSSSHFKVSISLGFKVLCQALKIDLRNWNKIRIVTFQFLTLTPDNNACSMGWFYICTLCYCRIYAPWTSVTTLEIIVCSVVRVPAFPPEPALNTIILMLTICTLSSVNILWTFHCGMWMCVSHRVSEGWISLQSYFFWSISDMAISAEQVDHSCLQCINTYFIPTPGELLSLLFFF